MFKAVVLYIQASKQKLCVAASSEYCGVEEERTKILNANHQIN